MEMVAGRSQWRSAFEGGQLLCERAHGRELCRRILMKKLLPRSRGRFPSGARISVDFLPRNCSWRIYLPILCNPMRVYSIFFLQNVNTYDVIHVKLRFRSQRCINSPILIDIYRRDLLLFHNLSKII